MQDLAVPTRSQKSTKLLQRCRNLDQLLMQPLHATIILALSKLSYYIHTHKLNLFRDSFDATNKIKSIPF